MNTSPKLSTKTYPLMMHFSLMSKSNRVTETNNYNASTQTSFSDARKCLDKCYTKHGTY